MNEIPEFRPVLGRVAHRRADVVERPHAHALFDAAREEAVQVRVVDGVIGNRAVAGEHSVGQKHGGGR